MKLHPTFTKGLSLATSALLLSGAVALFTPETIVEVEGAGEIQGAKMGSTFEDMSAGVLTAIKTTETTHAEIGRAHV